jgi:S-adenosylmethionine uptake transporter
MAVCGVIAAFGFYFLSQAYRLAQATTVAPFEYVGLPLAALWGYLFWSEVPDGMTVLGVMLIVGSGLYVFHRESIRGRRTAAGRGLRPRI